MEEERKKKIILIVILSISALVVVLAFLYREKSSERKLIQEVSKPTPPVDKKNYGGWIKTKDSKTGNYVCAVNDIKTGQWHSVSCDLKSYYPVGTLW